ncbi:hypothetical protein FTW19_20425 [Terriglobus albidus]|uniref:LPS export ABC transporter periplasmic protein LptC n=1 Tax=Terriglobus albidus TaxID=1592106 RepID=A0A5B9EH44_9BACT|nr:hypothetical protein [Terriglobus albidus]QEE30140.1 hypothetical protein FTW19_20425 [Terriglobus albidus]
MSMKRIFTLIVCVSTLAAAQDAAKPADQAPPPAASQKEQKEQKDQSVGTLRGIFGKKGKPVVNPEEEAKRKAEIQSQIDALPKQGAPMLDEAGKQMLDPDARPMFNPAPKPLRDKHGEPRLDEHGKLLLQTKDNLGYDEHGKKLKAVKEKEPKKVPVTIEQGTLTVDGWTGKARLNYDIADLKYLYIYAPGIGNTVISGAPFEGAIEQKNAFDGKTLTVSVSEHTLQLASEKPLLHQKHPASAYVRVDREYTMSSRFPVMGYGTLRRPPYAWPGAKAVSTTAPDLPKEVKPTLAAPKPVAVPPPAPTAKPSGPGTDSKR